MSQIPDDLHTLASAVAKNPRDQLTVQALADWIEEKGGEGSSVRALSIDGPTVLVFGWPESYSSADIEQFRTHAERIVQFLHDQTGHPLSWIAATKELTIRQIRAIPKGD
jgi:hypothetical protein